jgi:predicted MFS family arabinose efflux permease
VVFCTGIVRVFAGPTSFALVSQLVPRDKLTNAITWHSGTWQVAAVSGPALGGILYGVAGLTPTFLLMIVFMVISVTLAWMIRPKPIQSNHLQEPMFESIRKGFQFIWRSKEVLGAMSLDLFAVFFGGATALLPYFADQILKTGPQGLGMHRR